MSIFNGKMTPMGRLIAKVTGRSPVGESDISLKTEASADIETVKTMEGRISRAGKRFSASTMNLAIVYRFLDLVSNIQTGRNVTLDSANAFEMTTDAAVSNGREVRLAGEPAFEMTTDETVSTGREVRLVGEPAADLTLGKGIQMGHTVGIWGRWIVNLFHVKGIKMGRSTAVEGASGADIECDTTIHTGWTVNLSQAAAMEMGSVSSLQTGRVVAPSYAPANGISESSGIRIEHSALLGYWIEPVVVEGVLILRQAYAAIQDDKILEVT